MFSEKQRSDRRLVSAAAQGSLGNQRLAVTAGAPVDWHGKGISDVDACSSKGGGEHSPTQAGSAGSGRRRHGQQPSKPRLAWQQQGNLSAHVGSAEINGRQPVAHKALPPHLPAQSAAPLCTHPAPTSCLRFGLWAALTPEGSPNAIQRRWRDCGQWRHSGRLIPLNIWCGNSRESMGSRCGRSRLAAVPEQYAREA